MDKNKKNTCESNKIVDPSIYDADYYLAEGYNGDEKIFLDGLDKHEYLYNYPIELANLNLNNKILDIGCGIGKLAYKALKKGCIVTAIDYSKDAIKIANKIKQHLTPEEQHRIEFINGDALNISEEKKYDAIFMTDVIEHLYDWQLINLFEKLGKLLEKNGKIIIHTAPNRLNINFLYPLKRFLNFPSALRKKKGFFYKRSKYFYDPAMHINEQTLWSLKKLLKKFDCEIWCEDFSKNFLSMLTRKILGNHIWAIARLK